MNDYSVGEDMTFEEILETLEEVLDRYSDVGSDYDELDFNE